MSDPLKEIVLRAWTDSDFKNKLTSDSESVFKEFGISTNAKKIKVVENSKDTAYFVLPEAPDLSNIDKAQIEKVIDSVLAAQLVLPTILDS